MSGRSAVDEDALFVALCRIHEGADPRATFATLGGAANDVAGQGAPRAVDDDLPDIAEPALGDAVPSVEPSASGDGQRIDALLDEMIRGLGAYQGLLDRYNRDFDELFARRTAGAVEEADPTIERLRAAQTVLVKYPIAAQAAFAALVREGRRFAKTTEGKRWKAMLAGSATVARARTLFEGLSQGVVSEGGAALPTTFVEEFLRALDRDFEDVLADLPHRPRSP